MAPDFGDRPTKPYPGIRKPRPGPIPDDPEVENAFAKAALVIYAADAASVTAAEGLQKQLAARGGRVEIRRRAAP
jgi:hypothetical protein